MKSKKVIWLFIILAILVAIAGHCIAGSSFFTEMQKDRQQKQIVDSFCANAEYYTELAAAFLHESNGSPLYYNLAYSHGEISEELLHKVQSFSGNTNLDFDSIYIGGQTENLYPPDSCILRSTVYHNGDVYCWVDMVYNEHWDEELKSQSLQTMLLEERIIQLSPYWCVVILYGF